MAIRTIIIDDEWNNQQTLKLLLDDIPEVRILGMAADATAARQLVAQTDPQLVFLDINLPGEDGFRFLASVPDRNFEVVFVTAYNDYGIRALKVSAVDYLLKPIAFEELQTAVDKVSKILAVRDHSSQNLRVENLIRNAAQPQEMKIALPHLGGLSFVALQDISYLEADSNYTFVHRTDGSRLVVSRTLKDFEEILDEKGFMRVHKSAIVNLRYVQEYSSQDGGLIRMLQGGSVTLSRRLLDDFHRRMRDFSVGFRK